MKESILKLVFSAIKEGGKHLQVTEFKDLLTTIIKTLTEILINIK